MSNDIKYSNNILVEFSAIMDMDLAILRLIQLEYNNPEYFNIDILDKKSLKTDILSREYPNPLRFIIKDKYIDDVNKIYEDLIKQHSDMIYDICLPNDIFRLLLTLKRTSGIVNTTVLCLSEKEKDIIKKYDIKNVFNTLVVSERKKAELTNYDCVFVNRYRDILFYNLGQLAAKYIFIHRAKYNLEIGYKKQIPIIAVSKVVGDVNKVMLIDPYRNFNLL